MMCLFKAPTMVPKIRIKKTWKSHVELTWDEIPIERRNGIIQSYKIFYWNEKGPINGRCSNGGQNVSHVYMFARLLSIQLYSIIYHLICLGFFCPWSCLTSDFSFSCQCRPTEEDGGPEESQHRAAVWSVHDGQHIWWEPEWLNGSIPNWRLWSVSLVGNKTATHQMLR